jgi:hypothetical protein
MNHRVCIIASALLLSPLALPAAQARPLRTPASNHFSAVRNTLAGLGHEGSGLHKRRHEAPVMNAFANLGVEGSGLTAAWQAAAVRPWAQ